MRSTDLPKPELQYRADDRSLLLPAYRRWLVDPIVPLLPARLNPNTITHAGHALNLAAVVLLALTFPARGWPLVFAALLLQVYIWCDNADGAHARRTGQCTPYGELLDHGLDILNVAYIGFLSAFALGVDERGCLLVTTFISGAASFTYWEQTATGVFRLGRINQVESGIVLSSVLVGSAIWGTELWTSVSFAGITPRLFFVIWTCSTIAFGMAQNALRIGRALGWRATWIGVPLIAFEAMVALAWEAGALPIAWAVALATAANVFFATRMLATRIGARQPRVELALVVGSLALAALFALEPGRAELQVFVAVAVIATLSALTFRDARRGRRAILGRAG